MTDGPYSIRLAVTGTIGLLGGMLLMTLAGTTTSSGHLAALAVGFLVTVLIKSVGESIYRALTARRRRNPTRPRQ